MAPAASRTGESAADEQGARPRICVFSPSPYFTVAVEDGSGSEPEIHFHAGGQGVWVARMIAALGAEPVLCAPLGGESGVVLRALLEAEGRSLRAVESLGANGGYLHDRRGGERKEIALAQSARLTRHEQDELYNTALVTAIECGVLVLTGPAQEAVMDADVYRRFALDASHNGVRVVADLALGALQALAGGVTVLKVSHEELVAAGFARGDGVAELLAGMRALRGRSESVLVSRADDPALALFDDRLYQIRPLRMEALEHRGAGDSMTAALAVGLGRGLPTEELLRLAAAAGALNVTRRGLGSGRRENVEALARHVEVVAIEA
jgi:1-phosphofructokinase